MAAYNRCSNLGKNLVDNVALYGRGREIFRPSTYVYEVKYNLPVIVTKNARGVTEM
jgi:hypothetical protein